MRQRLCAPGPRQAVWELGQPPAALDNRAVASEESRPAGLVCLLPRGHRQADTVPQKLCPAWTVSFARAPRCFQKHLSSVCDCEWHFSNVRVYCTEHCYVLIRSMLRVSTANHEVGRIAPTLQMQEPGVECFGNSRSSPGSHTQQLPLIPFSSRCHVGGLQASDPALPFLWAPTLTSLCTVAR